MAGSTFGGDTMVPVARTQPRIAGANAANAGNAANAADRARTLRPHRRAVVKGLAACLVALAVLGGGWVWLRDSTFASVEQVTVSGVKGPDAGAIVAALRSAAVTTSTLDVNLAALRGATARFPQVRSVSVAASFPHTLHIAVAEQLPVAVLVGPSGARTAAAANGAVLGPSLAGAALASVTVSDLPDHIVRDPGVLECLAVLGGAPSALQALIADVSVGPKGVTALLRDGVRVYFGDASRPYAKWLAFARVLVAEGPVAATYVDVRIPERPAVGGGSAGATSPAGAADGSAAPSSASTGASAALVAAFRAALGASGQPQPATGGASNTELSASQTTADEAQSATPAGGESATPTQAPEGSSGSFATAPATGAAEPQSPTSGPSSG